MVNGVLYKLLLFIWINSIKISINIQLYSKNYNKLTSEIHHILSFKSNLHYVFYQKKIQLNGTMI